MRFLVHAVEGPKKRRARYPYIFHLSRQTEPLPQGYRGWRNYVHTTMDEAETWGRERFGNPDRHATLDPYTARWRGDRNADQIVFRFQNDAIEFKLRWC